MDEEKGLEKMACMHMSIHHIESAQVDISNFKTR